MTNVSTPSDVTQSKFRLFGMTPARFAARYGGLLGLIVLVVFFSLISPLFLRGSNVSNILWSAAAQAPLAAGMLLVVITAGVDLSAGAVLAVSMSLLAVMISIGAGPLVASIACLAMGMLWGWINGILVTKLRPLHPFIVTLATMYVARGLSLLIPGEFGGSAITFRVEVGPSYEIALFIIVALYVIFHVLLSNTSLGRHIYAVGGNAEAARISGINVSRTLIIVYSLSGLMAGLAAWLFAERLRAFFPGIGTGYELNAIAAVMIGGASLLGGVGTIAGTAIGVVTIAVLQNGINLLGISAYWQNVVIGLIIISALFVDVLRRRARE